MPENGTAEKNAATPQCPNCHQRHADRIDGCVDAEIGVFECMNGNCSVLQFESGVER